MIIIQIIKYKGDKMKICIFDIHTISKKCEICNKNIAETLLFQKEDGKDRTVKAICSNCSKEGLKDLSIDTIISNSIRDRFFSASVKDIENEFNKIINNLNNIKKHSIEMNLFVSVLKEIGLFSDTDFKNIYEKCINGLNYNVRR